MSAVLEVTDLCKEYGSGSHAVRALDGVSLEVQQGEFVAIMGASGSGKSTLLHLIGGLDLPTSGRVLIEGQDIAAMSDRKRTLFRRRRLGVVFQAFNLLPTLSAAENVALPLMVDGSRGNHLEKAAQVLDAVALTHRIGHRPQAMSGGEQQRVAIARSIVNDPALLLADEPTGNLDSRHAASIWSLLRELVNEQNRTVIAVTHETSGARYADRIIVLKDGSIIGTIQTNGDMDAALVAARYTELAG